MQETSDKQAAPTRAEFTFFERIRVRWAEVDLQGIVFNPNYFVYFDTAITEYMRAVGFPYPEGLTSLGSDFFAVDARATFRGSAVFDDLLDAGVRVARIGRTSVTFEVGIFRGDTLLVKGELVYVNAAREVRTPTPVPEAFIERVMGFERTPPVRKGIAG